MNVVDSLDAALGHIPAGARLVASPGCGAPTTLLAGVGRLAATRGGLHLYSGVQLPEQPFLKAVARRELRYTTWHVTAQTRPLVAAGLVDYLPTRLSDVGDVVSRLAPDVALVRVSSPERGKVSLGPSLSYSREAIAAAPVVIAEVDDSLPWTSGDTLVEVDRITAMVISQSPTPAYRPPPPGADVTDVARHLLELIPASPTLQIGIGQVPEAVGPALLRHGVADLRFIGMGTDALVDLADAGLLRAASPAGVAPINVVELMGGQRLMRFADRNPLVALHPSTRGHSPGWLASSFERIVSINSALQVDLRGQVNAEMLDAEQISGVGGSADFVDAARASHEGVSIIALLSTSHRGSRSRIVPKLGSATMTTIAAHSAQVIVTEHGSADLRGLTVRERARALVAIASPAHRDALSRA